MTVSSHMITSLWYSVFKNHGDVALGFVHDIDIKVWSLLTYSAHYKVYIFEQDFCSFYRFIALFKNA